MHVLRKTKRIQIKRNTITEFVCMCYIFLVQPVSTLHCSAQQFCLSLTTHFNKPSIERKISLSPNQLLWLQTSTAHLSLILLFSILNIENYWFISLIFKSVWRPTGKTLDATMNHIKWTCILWINPSTYIWSIYIQHTNGSNNTVDWALSLCNASV